MNDIAVHGITSMIRDLSLLTDDPAALEAEIVAAGGAPLRTPWRRCLRLLRDEGRVFEVGDVVVFRLKAHGAYREMETLWGRLLPLEPGRDYLGVLCERSSTKLIAAQFPAGASLGACELQLIAQAGGIGFATGFSPSLRAEVGSGTPSDVEVRGFVFDDERGGVLNTVALADDGGDEADDDGRCPPLLLVLGVATDVGKTTTLCRLLEPLSRSHACAALKASGTGWFNDSLEHGRSGAFPVLNFTFGGLPTTYFVEPAVYRRVMRRVLARLARPERIPVHHLEPGLRRRRRPAPELIVVEHGGDLIFGNVPTFLEEPGWRAATLAVILCSDGAMSLRCGLQELARLGIRSSSALPIYAAMPLCNPEGFYKRLEAELAAGSLAGIFDTNKPALSAAKDRRQMYSQHYDDILSGAEMAAELSGLMRRRTPAHR